MGGKGDRKWGVFWKSVMDRSREKTEALRVASGASASSSEAWALEGPWAVLRSLTFQRLLLPAGQSSTWCFWKQTVSLMFALLFTMWKSVLSPYLWASIYPDANVHAKSRKYMWWSRLRLYKPVPYTPGIPVTIFTVLQTCYYSKSCTIV